MTQEEAISTFEQLLIEMQYIIADLTHERANEAALSDVASVTKVHPKLGALHCLVDVGMAVVDEVSDRGARSEGGRLMA